LVKCDEGTHCNLPGGFLTDSLILRITGTKQRSSYAYFCVGA